MTDKTHYRKVFKSNHMGVADLEDYVESGKQLVFTIKEVKQEFNVMVAGSKGNYNIAYFTDKSIKPLVLNATNSKIVKSFANGSSFVEDWSNLPVQLYIDANVRMMGEVVGGVRIMPQQPRVAKKVLTPKNEKAWSRAIQSYKDNGDLKIVLENCDISKEDQKAIIEIGQTELDAANG